MSKRRICVVTGSRADYGLLSGVMRAVKQDDALQLQIVVTGAHLDTRFGETVHEIEADGFMPDERVSLDLADDTDLAIAQATGKGVEGLARAFSRLVPDIVVLLGDRYETLAAATAAVILKIPVAHIHGGEITEGAIDEIFRHAVSKMAQLHFPAAEPYAKRLIQMGEAPEKVHVVGALGVDAVRAAARSPLKSAAVLEDLNLFDPIILVTYHPVTIRAGVGSEEESVSSLLSALDQFPRSRILITGVNADPGYEAIAKRLVAYTNKNSKRVSLHASLGQQRYLAVMCRAAVVVGNSSSGIVEAPAMGVPTVNIGDRQKGRLKAASVIDCEESAQAITSAIARALDPTFRKSIHDQDLPYGGGDAVNNIVSILRNCDLAQLQRKQFTDISFLSV